MKLFIVLFFMSFGFSVNASILECDTLLPGQVKGPQLYFSNERIYTLDEMSEVIYFDKTHYCGIPNKIPKSKLMYKLEDISSQSPYLFEVSGISSLKRENYSSDITVSFISLNYGKKDGSRDLGAFSCGLDQIQVLLILKNCIIK